MIMPGSLVSSALHAEGPDEPYLFRVLKKS